MKTIEYDTVPEEIEVHTAPDTPPHEATVMIVAPADPAKRIAFFRVQIVETKAQIRAEYGLLKDRMAAMRAAMGRVRKPKPKRGRARKQAAQPSE